MRPVAVPIGDINVPIARIENLPMAAGSKNRSWSGIHRGASDGLIGGVKLVA